MIAHTVTGVRLLVTLSRMGNREGLWVARAAGILLYRVKWELVTEAASACAVRWVSREAA
jgi:hypothetical protein